MPFNDRAPFTRKQAIAAGLTDAVLRGPSYQQVLWGVYISSRIALTLTVRSLAALMVAPAGSVVSHHTAARLWGGTPPETGELHITTAGSNRAKTRGIQAHRVTALPEAVTHHGLPVTSPEGTFVDLARCCDLLQLVVLGDSLVRAKATTPAALVAACAGIAGRAGALARRAASLVRDRVDSPMESRLRMLIVLAGLPEPVVNIEVSDEGGRLRYRIDLSFPDQRLAIEFDGRHHVDVRSQWESDVLRREDLEADGWRFLVVTSSQLYSSPEDVLSRCVAAMRDRGVRVPSRTRTEWRRYFVGARDVA